MSAAVVTLDPASVDAIAERVAELLRGAATAPDLIDAAEVARRLGISRGSVYELADELGAHRIGDGPRARLRFDPALIAERLTPAEPSTPSTPPRRTAPPCKRPANVDLLPIGRRGAP